MYAPPLRKTLNVIFSHYASNGNKQLSCSTVTELVQMSKALESIICLMYFVIIFDKLLDVY